MSNGAATVGALLVRLVGVEHHDREPQFLGFLDVGQLSAVVQAVVDDQTSGKEYSASEIYLLLFILC